MTTATTPTTRRVGAVLLTLGLALGATACSGTASPSGSGAAGAATITASGPYAAADVAFATQMIPHHQQAVQMAEIALATSRDEGVRALATQITAAQGPEIETMTRFLTAWGATPAPGGAAGSAGSDGMEGMDHSSGSDSGPGSGPGSGMPGMMTDAEMTALAAATGPAFDRMWLTMMIAHHQGAVTMSRTELGAGSSAEAKALATSIIAGQTAELTTMGTMLRTATTAG